MKRRNEKKKGLHRTVIERIMLHLMQYPEFEDHVDVPFALTQEGIASAVMIQRSAVPRAMKDLISKGLAVSRKAHVKGMMRQRKVYFLSPEGYKVAREIAEELLSTTVEVNTPNGTEHMTVEDMLKSVNSTLLSQEGIKEKMQRINKREFTVADLSNVFLSEFKSGVVDMDKLMLTLIAHVEDMTAPGKQQSGYNVVGREKRRVFGTKTQIKVPEVFVGRKAELETLYGWLRARDVRYVGLYGIAGIGKTSLVNKLLGEYLPPDYYVFFFRVHAWDTVSDLLMEFRDYMEGIGYKYKGPLNSIGPVRHVLYQGVKDFPPTVFVFDDLHLAQDHRIIEFIYVLMEACETAEHLKVILISRDRFFSNSDTYVVDGMAKEMTLSGLDKDGAKELALRLNHPKDMPPYALSQGNPLIMQIISQSARQKGSTSVKADVVRFLNEEVFDMLPQDEKHLLCAMSVWRGKFRREDLVPPENLKDNGNELIEHVQTASLSEIRYIGMPKSLFSWSLETWNSLVEKGIIVADVPESYGIHDLLYDTVYNHMSGPEKRWYHLYAGVLCLKDIEGTVGGKIEGGHEALERPLIEAIYHLVRARAVKAGAQLILKYCHVVLKSRRLGDIRPLAMEILNFHMQSNILTTKEQAILHLIMAKSAYFSNNLIDCDRHLSEALEALKSFKDNRYSPLIHYELGRIYTKRGDMEKAREHLNEGLRTLRGEPGGPEAWAIMGALGDTHWIQGDYSNALVHYLKAVREFNRIYDLPREISNALEGAVNTAMRESIDRGTVLLEGAVTKLQEWLGPRNTYVFNMIGDYYFKILFCINANKLFSEGQYDY